ARRVHLHHADLPREPHAHAVGGDRLGVLPRGSGALRAPDRRHLPRLQPPVRHRERARAAVAPLWIDAGRRACQGAVGREALGPDARPLVRGYGVRPQERAADARDAQGRGARVDGPGRVGRGPGPTVKAAPSEPITIHVEVLSWVNRFLGGPGTGQMTVEEAVPRGAGVRPALPAMSARFA